MEEKTKQEKLSILTAFLIDCVAKHKNLKVHFKDKSKRKLVNSIKITGVKLSEEDIEHKVDNDEIDCFLSANIIQKTEEVRKQLEEVKDRHRELRKLEEDIMELTELYNEMFELVQSHGLTVNNAETKVNTTKVTITEGEGALKIAADLYDKALSKKKMLALILTAICLVLLIIIIAASTSGSDAESDKDTVMIHQACDPSMDDDCVG
eukprot:GFUD01051204.1.p1 GENE.GFUD01051204.1~~GFUD01051204.1.p1  ORF type:complete len:208 (-),score=76.05 GFUD01051204.1:177-800(-)